LGFCGAAGAQQANPLDVIPEKMPFSVPYGAPISLARAQAAIGAVTAEAEKHGWALNVAVDDSGANLVAFARMDGAQLASIAISEHKARASVNFRRPTKAFEEGIQKNDYKYQLSLDDAFLPRLQSLAIAKTDARWPRGQSAPCPASITSPISHP
jgi:hypothetical protein